FPINGIAENTSTWANALVFSTLITSLFNHCLCTGVSYEHTFCALEDSDIERSLTDQPQFVLADREAFAESDASILLYGADNRKGVVAIEPAGPYEVEVFFADGWKKRWSERH